MLSLGLPRHRYCSSRTDADGATSSRPRALHHKTRRAHAFREAPCACVSFVPELELPAPRNVTYAHLECLRISTGRGRRVPNGHVTGGRRRTRNLINEAASVIASGTSRPGPGLASRNVTFRVATGVNSARPGATRHLHDAWSRRAPARCWCSSSLLVLRAAERSAPGPRLPLALDGAR